MNGSLATDLQARSNLRVSLPDWDSYILGGHEVLQEHVMTIGEVARIEEERWSKGRFPSVPLVIADAVFSKQAQYGVAVQRRIRPFADHFADMSTEEFAQLGWPKVHEIMSSEGVSSEGRTPHHLSPAGRARSICGAVDVFLDQGCARIEDARNWAVSPETRSALAPSILRVPGVAGAMLQNIRMNLGAGIMKLDVHVRRVLARHSGLDPAAPAERYEQYLDQVAGELPWSRFQIDQILWYSENRKGRV